MNSTFFSIRGFCGFCEYIWINRASNWKYRKHVEIVYLECVIKWGRKETAWSLIRSNCEYSRQTEKLLKFDKHTQDQHKSQIYICLKSDDQCYPIRNTLVRHMTPKSKKQSNSTRNTESNNLHQNEMQTQLQWVSAVSSIASIVDFP